MGQGGGSFNGGEETGGPALRPVLSSEGLLVWAALPGGPRFQAGFVLRFVSLGRSSGTHAPLFSEAGRKGESSVPLVLLPRGLSGGGIEPLTVSSSFPETPCLIQ